MRVITTWMYFDDKQINSEPGRRRYRGRGEKPDPGIGIAWIGGDTSDIRPFEDVDEFHLMRDLHNRVDDPGALKSYIDLFLMDADEFEFNRSERSLKNAGVVDYVLSQPFVIEQSPPSHIDLKGALKKTNAPLWIGTYMGWAIVPEPSVMLFLTVPGGIIAVSSATGLAAGLAAGLSKSVSRLFDVKPSRPRISRKKAPPGDE